MLVKYVWVCLNCHVIDVADKEDEEEGGEGSKDGEDGETGKKTGVKRKKASSCVTIEKCPSALDITNFETEFRADPLFQKTAAAFDEGGVAGLLLNNINVR